MKEQIYLRTEEHGDGMATLVHSGAGSVETPRQRVRRIARMLIRVLGRFLVEGVFAYCTWLTTTNPHISTAWKVAGVAYYSTLRLVLYWRSR